MVYERSGSRKILLENWPLHFFHPRQFPSHHFSTLDNFLEGNGPGWENDRRGIVQVEKRQEGNCPGWEKDIRGIFQSS